MKDKLIKIQKELKAPKNQVNNFGGYNYRSCEDILEAVKPLLEEEGLLLRLSDELVNIGDRYYIKAIAVLTDGNETIENISYAREEENKKGMDGSQITGASSSYARKYALNGLFLIDDVKDSDSTNVGVEMTKEEAEKYTLTFGKNKGKKISELEDNYIEWLLNNSKDQSLLKAIELVTGQVPLTEEGQKEQVDLASIFEELLIKTDTDREQLYDHYGVNKYSEMSEEQIKEAIAIMKKKVGK